MLRKTAKGEDLATMALCPKLPPPVPQVLPARQEMEMESEQMKSLAEQIMASNREELSVVRALEEELRTSRTAKADTSRSASKPMSKSQASVAEVKSQAAELEISRLEAELRARSDELNGFESEVAAQQHEIQSLLDKRFQEEQSADAAFREVRDVNAEIKTCKRTCGSLDSEIASEEVRATALREAFEGRRARFATAETAARNAELSTMRAWLGSRVRRAHPSPSSARAAPLPSSLPALRSLTLSARLVPCPASRRAAQRPHEHAFSAQHGLGASV
jgi:chromosome segregation ATPase